MKKKKKLHNKFPGIIERTRILVKKFLPVTMKGLQVSATRARSKIKIRNTAIAGGYLF